MIEKIRLPKDLRWIRPRWLGLRMRAGGYPHASLSDLVVLWKAQGGVCPETGIELMAGNVALDHINPRRHGGTHTIENLRWVSADFNKRKKDKSPPMDAKVIH